MQARMKKYPLTEIQIRHLLETEAVGRLATTGADGYPYVTPVHFVFLEGKIYVHGLAAGEKLQNITSRPKVGFEVEAMRSIIHVEEDPCDTNTEYKSVIVRGNATILADSHKKTAILNAVVAKYTPQHAGKTFQQKMLNMTGIIEITIQSCTGKFYPGQSA